MVSSTLAPGNHCPFLFCKGLFGETLWYEICCIGGYQLKHCNLSLWQPKLPGEDHWKIHPYKCPFRHCLQRMQRMPQFPLPHCWCTLTLTAHSSDNLARLLVHERVSVVFCRMSWRIALAITCHLDFFTLHTRQQLLSQNSLLFPTSHDNWHKWFLDCEVWSPSKECQVHEGCHRGLSKRMGTVGHFSIPRV